MMSMKKRAGMGTEGIFVGTKRTVFVEGKGVIERVPSESHFGKGDGQREGAVKKPEYSWLLTRSGTGRILLLEPAPASEKQASENRVNGLDALLGTVLGFLDYGKSKNALADMRVLKQAMLPEEADAQSQKLLAIAGLGGSGPQGNELEDVIEIRRIAVALLPKSFGEEKAMLCESIADDCKRLGKKVWAAEAYRDAARFTPDSNRKGMTARYVKMAQEYAAANQIVVAVQELERAGEAGKKALEILARKEPAFKQRP